jgi:hypothetical protein
VCGGLAVCVSLFVRMCGCIWVCVWVCVGVCECLWGMCGCVRLCADVSLCASV